MLILKLNLPEVKVNYNYLGACTSELVPYTPDKIKGIQMNIEVTGYAAEDAFFAFKLSSPDRALTLSEQYSLLTRIGFRTVPVEHYPNIPGAINGLIKVKTKFAKYDPTWWDIDTDTEFPVPVLADVHDVDFRLDEHHRLVRVLSTDAGIFDVLDQRIPEYYQPGSVVKVMDGKVEPFQPTEITIDTPYNCPVCNNPLKKYQLANDLPLIYKCVSSFCDMLDTTADPLPEVEVGETDESFRQSTVEETTELAVDEDNAVALDENVTGDTDVEVIKLKVVNLEVEVDSEEFQDAVQFVTDGPANYVLKNSNRSITKASRKVAREYDIPTITLDELRRIVNG